jgi:glycosyltransferase involved in cell wall biosynthesis
MSLSPAATVVIVTRNRAEELRTAIQSVLMQDVPVALLVYDDASTDNTPAVVREFDGIEFHRSLQSVGYVFHRNAAVVAARTPIVLMLDDDAYLTDPSTIRVTLNDFDHPRVGVVAVPFSVDGSTHRQPRPPDDQRVWVANTFIGAVHALRRDLFVRLGGLRADLRHWGEEAIYSLRLLSHGFVVRRGNAPTAVHAYSPIRDKKMIDYYAVRNHIYVSWNCIPMPLALARMLAFSGKDFLQDSRHRFKWLTLRALLAGWRACAATITSRDAPDYKTYKLYNELRRRRTVPLDEIESRLIPIAADFCPVPAAELRPIARL